MFMEELGVAVNRGKSAHSPVLNIQTSASKPRLEGDWGFLTQICYAWQAKIHGLSRGEKFDWISVHGPGITDASPTKKSFVARGDLRYAWQALVEFMWPNPSDAEIASPLGRDDGGAYAQMNMRAAGELLCANDTMKHLAVLNEVKKYVKGQYYTQTDVAWDATLVYDSANNPIKPGSTPAAPKLTNHEIDMVVVLVMSGRSKLAHRNTIRETWAKHHKNVFFMVGAHGCSIPKEYQRAHSCFLKGVPPDDMQAAHDKALAAEDAALAKEAATYGDLVQLPMVDSYLSLPRKLKESYRWALERTGAKWLLKIDDDSYVRVEKFIADTSGWKVGGNVDKILHLGGIQRGYPHQSGKWMDLVYPKGKKYPPFPRGAGHVANRPLASYIVEHSDSLVEQQGEDTSMGVWFKNAPGKKEMVVNTIIDATSNGNCYMTNKHVIGHNIADKKMRACFAKTEGWHRL